MIEERDMDVARHVFQYRPRGDYLSVEVITDSPDQNPDEMAAEQVDLDRYELVRCDAYLPKGRVTMREATPDDEDHEEEQGWVVEQIKYDEGWQPIGHVAIDTGMLCLTDPLNVPHLMAEVEDCIVDKPYFSVGHEAVITGSGPGDGVYAVMAQIRDGRVMRVLIEFQEAQDD